METHIFFLDKVPSELLLTCDNECDTSGTSNKAMSMHFQGDHIYFKNLSFKWDMCYYVEPLFSLIIFPLSLVS